VPAGFVAVSASRCLFRIEPVPGDGSWQVRVEQRATGGLAALVAALRLPSVENRGMMCSAVGHLPVVITLTDAQGRSVVPLIPHGTCGGPLPEVTRAIEALPWQETGRTRVNQVQTQLEIDSGCPARYKPMVALSADRAPGGDRFPFPGGQPSAVRVCRYRLDPSDTMTGRAGLGRYQIGVLDTAGTLTGKSLTRVLQAVAAAPPVRSCTEPEAPFAVLTPADRGPVAYVELAGCYRVADESGTVRQLDAATAALLVA
jgi:hypothetical protein